MSNLPRQTEDSHTSECFEDLVFVTFTLTSGVPSAPSSIELFCIFKLVTLCSPITRFRQLQLLNVRGLCNSGSSCLVVVIHCDAGGGCTSRTSLPLTAMTTCILCPSLRPSVTVPGCRWELPSPQASQGGFQLQHFWGSLLPQVMGAV